MMSSSGNSIANQFIITSSTKTVFQSYNSIIVVRNHKSGTITLDRETWDYSVTTGKYRNIFLGETKKETQAKIDSGEYKLKDLN